MWDDAFCFFIFFGIRDGRSLETEVTFYKKKHITWLKGIFWIPWEAVRNCDEKALHDLLRKVEVETTLEVAGVLSTEKPGCGDLGLLCDAIPKFCWAHMSNNSLQKPDLYIQQAESDEWVCAGDVFLACFH